MGRGLLGAVNIRWFREVTGVKVHRIAMICIGLIWAKLSLAGDFAEDE